MQKALKSPIRLLPRHLIVQEAVRAVSVGAMLEGCRRREKRSEAEAGKDRSSAMNRVWRLHVLSAPHGQGRLGICLGELLDMCFASPAISWILYACRIRYHLLLPLDQTYLGR